MDKVKNIDLTFNKNKYMKSETNLLIPIVVDDNLLLSTNNYNKIIYKEAYHPEITVNEFLKENPYIKQWLVQNEKEALAEGLEFKLIPNSSTRALFKPGSSEPIKIPNVWYVNTDRRSRLPILLMALKKYYLVNIKNAGVKVRVRWDWLVEDMPLYVFESAEGVGYRDIDLYYDQFGRAIKIYDDANQITYDITYEADAALYLTLTVLITNNNGESSTISYDLTPFGELVKTRTQENGVTKIYDKNGSVVKYETDKEVREILTSSKFSNTTDVSKFFVIDYVQKIIDKTDEQNERYAIYFKDGMGNITLSKNDGIKFNTKLCYEDFVFKILPNMDLAKQIFGTKDSKSEVIMEFKTLEQFIPPVISEEDSKKMQQLIPDID